METPREVIPPAVIAARVRELGAQIGADYRGREVVLVGMLKGAAVFLADLLRAIDGQVRFELVNVVQQPATRGELVELTYATQVHLAGAHALILKDICHSGVTENYLLTHLAQQQPASLEVATFVNKPKLRRVALEPRYVAFDEVPEGRLVGYGMEFEGRWGNLPGLYVIG
ncbi:MAG TPA: phosphoribosyltransferase family protein [Thermoanaerobaculaceae bacterium]|mgnify:CR=1 FL=1|nr:phosphoribosyltransferase family protein [Thermoanaerobaculaceae bacterium]HRS16237.1 phosphoribosyltransferase family protein [Thermoanaerobaculaceae bacterium]